MCSTARGGLPNSIIEAHRVRIHRHLALAADAQRLVYPGHEEDQLHEARPFDDVGESCRSGCCRRGPASAAVFGPPTWMKPGLPPLRRSVDAAVRARCGQNAKRRHADEFLRVDVDLRALLRDHARRGGGIDGGEVGGGKIGQGMSPRGMRRDGSKIPSRYSRGHPLCFGMILRAGVAANRATREAREFTPRPRAQNS